MEVAADEGCDALLVVGTRGTLEPFAATSVLGEGERLAGEQLPPFAEELLEPWLNRALRQVNAARMLATNAVGGKPVPLDSLLQALKLRLSDLISPALGEWSAKADAAAFWRTFPALRWLVARAVRDWSEGASLFLQRLACDQGLLAQSMGGAPLPAVASVETTAADLHPRGAMVLRVGFTKGGCVFYKPRPVTGEWLWSALLEAISGEVQLPAGRVVFGGQANGQSTYGWMESVREEEAWPVRPHAVRSNTRWNYWERAGAVLCLAQHLRLTDLHMGNVLATPYGPAITDAECLGTVGSTTSVSGEFAHMLQRLRDTGLLPQSMGPAVDVSGLFGRAGAVTGLRVSRWAVSRTGSWRLAKLPAALVPHGNLPQYADAASPRAVAAQLCSGYRRGAELLMQVREQLLAAGSPWRQTLETMHAPRCVLRETLSYGKLLSQSLAASSVRDHRERRKTLAASLSAQGPSVSERVMHAEIRALMAASVPRLGISPSSPTLRDSDGRPLQRNFSDRTPSEAVVRELESLTKARLEETLLPALLAALL